MTVPTPTVHGPPIMKTTRGGTGADSARQTATLIAWPVALETLSLTVMLWSFLISLTRLIIFWMSFLLLT